MEWRSAAIVLAASPLGEADCVATALTEAHGLARGLVRGGWSRRSRPTWEVGARVALRWRGRLAEQLGGFTGEATAQPLASLIDRPLALATLRSCCAVAAASLAPGVAVGATYAGLCGILDRLGNQTKGFLPGVVRWEIGLLAELGYGLDLSGVAEGAAGQDVLVSPRTGLAVAREAAGAWAPRLLALPDFVRAPSGDAAATARSVGDGLRLSGHFLRRDVFDPIGRREPAERARLVAMVERLCDREGDGRSAE